VRPVFRAPAPPPRPIPLPQSQAANVALVVTGSLILLGLVLLIYWASG